MHLHLLPSVEALSLQGASGSAESSVSANGRYSVFSSTSSNLNPTDAPNGYGGTSTGFEAIVQVPAQVCDDGSACTTGDICHNGTCNTEAKQAAVRRWRTFAKGGAARGLGGFNVNVFLRDGYTFLCGVVFEHLDLRRDGIALFLLFLGGNAGIDHRPANFTGGFVGGFVSFLFHIV